MVSQLITTFQCQGSSRHVHISFAKIFTANKFSALSSRGPPCIHTERLCGELALDESQSLGSVLVDVLLVGVGVVAVAAVRVGGVAVRLNDGGACWCALEARWTGGELESM